MMLLSEPLQCNGAVELDTDLPEVLYGLGPKSLLRVRWQLDGCAGFSRMMTGRSHPGLNDRMEQFSYAYVAAVATAAGFAVQKRDPDWDSVDIQIFSGGSKGLPGARQIEAQLKCTTPDVLNKSELIYDLPIKNFRDLRAPVTYPRILIVVVVPPLPEDWTIQSETKLELRQCGYWKSLREEPESTNVASVRIRIPRIQVFSTSIPSMILQGFGGGGAP
jgi:hypothetical protein